MRVNILLASVVTCIVTLIATLYVTDNHVVFESPTLLPLLNTLFLSIIPFFSAYTAARIFLSVGNIPLLMIGSSALALGIGGLVSGWFINSAGGPNTTITIYNYSALCSSFLLLLSEGAFLIYPTWNPVRNRLRFLTGLFFGVVIIVGTMVVCAVYGITSPFIIQGSGPTDAGKVVLSTAIIFFGVSAVLLTKHFNNSGTYLLRWYLTGVVLIAIGLTGVLLQKSVGSPIGWVGRTSQYLGAVFILIGVLSFWRSIIGSSMSLEAAFEEVTRERINDLELVNDQLQRIIAEQLKMEESLKKSRQLLKETEKIGNVGGWEFDIDTKLQTWTDEVYNIHEVDLTFVPTVENGINFYTPESRPVITQAVKMAIEDGKPFDEKLEIVTAKGNLRSIHAIGKRDLEHRRIFGFFQDITEQKHIEEKIIASERDFRALAENTPNLIIRYDLDCRRVYVNQAFLKNTNKTFDELVGSSPCSGPLPTRKAIEHTERLRLVLDTGVAVEYILEWIKPNGRLSSYAVNVVAERDNHGNVTGCLAILHDLSLIKEAEQRLSRLAENLPGAMYTFLLRPDGSSCVPYSSANIEKLLGLPSDKISQGMSDAFALIHPDDAEAVQSSIAESARTLSQWQMEYRISHPVNGIIWVEGRSMPKRLPDGSILWHGFIHDITSRKINELSLRKKREQLIAMAVEMTMAEERERRRIAAELHDNIGQTLLLSRIKLGTLANLFVSDSDKITYKEVISLFEQTIGNIRSMTQKINPPMLSNLGLDAALEWLSSRMEADYSLLVDFSDDLHTKQLSEELSFVIYHSARELLINVAKHAGINRAALNIFREDNMLVLEVIDKGAGFMCMSDYSKSIPLDNSFGLFNIRQRIQLLGGSVQINSSPGSGTHAAIRVPIKD